MPNLTTAILLALVAAFVLFAARWQARPSRLRVLSPELNEIPIVTPDGELLTRESDEREAAMRAALLASDRLSRREWNASMDRILLVHDDLTNSELGVLLARVPPGLLPPEESREAAPRERFLAALAGHDHADAVEPLGTHFAPGPFDAYRLRDGSKRPKRRG